MMKDSSTECWNQIDINEWINKAQSNDFRMYYIMPYTLEKLGDESHTTVEAILL